MTSLYRTLAPGAIKTNELVKKSTGIVGLDEITDGGLPSRRLAAVTGGPGSGKTVFALQFLVHRSSCPGGALQVY